MGIIGNGLIIKEGEISSMIGTSLVHRLQLLKECFRDHVATGIYERMSHPCIIILLGNPALTTPLELQFNINVFYEQFYYNNEDMKLRL